MAKADTVSEKKEYLSVGAILDANDTQYADVDVPEWGGSIRIGTLQAGEMLEWVEANEGKARRTAGLRLLIKSLVDSDGKRIGRPEHIDGLKQKAHSVVNRVVDEILKLNNLNVRTKDDAKNGSGEAPGDASPTD